MKARTPTSTFNPPLTTPVTVPTTASFCSKACFERGPVARLRHFEARERVVALLVAAGDGNGKRSPDLTPSALFSNAVRGSTPSILKPMSRKTCRPRRRSPCPAVDSVRSVLCVWSFKLRSSRRSSRRVSRRSRTGQPGPRVLRALRGLISGHRAACALRSCVAGILLGSGRVGFRECFVSHGAYTISLSHALRPGVA